MYNCNKCRDKGVYEENGSFITCVFCGGKQKLMGQSRISVADAQSRLMGQLKISIANAKSRGNKDLYQGLVAVRKFLPKYPVMAVMEAEARNLLPAFIAFIRYVFDIKAFHEPVDRQKQKN